MYLLIDGCDMERRIQHIHITAQIHYDFHKTDAIYRSVKNKELEDKLCAVLAEYFNEGNLETTMVDNRDFKSKMYER